MIPLIGKINRKGDKKGRMMKFAWEDTGMRWETWINAGKKLGATNMTRH